MTQSNNALCTSFHIQGGPKRSQEMRPTISTKSLTKISFFFEKIEPGSSYLVKALWLHGNFCEATSFKKKKCYFCNRSCASRSEKFAHDGFQYNHLCLRKQFTKTEKIIEILKKNDIVSMMLLKLRGLRYFWRHPVYRETLVFVAWFSIGYFIQICWDFSESMSNKQEDKSLLLFSVQSSWRTWLGSLKSPRKSNDAILSNAQRNECFNVSRFIPIPWLQKKSNACVV